jgi:phosphatidate cytidylyltransferase
MKRILTAAVALPILLYTIWSSSPYPFIALAIIAALIALSEFYSLAEGVGAAPAGLPGYLCAIAIAACFAMNRTAWIAALFVVLVLVLLALRLLKPSQLSTSLVAVSTALFGVAYVALLSGCLIGVRAGAGLGHYAYASSQSKLLTTFFAMVIFTDTGAYYTGRSIGRHKLAPAISPGKTIEGSAGGFIAAVAAGPVSRLLFFPELPLADSLLLGAVIGIVSQVGDLAESMLKRSAGVKDSGTLLPGHGGMLDRIDSILFCAPIVYYYYRYFYPGS